MIKQKFTKRLLYCMSLFFLISSFILDIMTSNGIIKVFFIVSNDFVPSIFSGILTFSTLSQTVLSIIVSVIDTKNYGLKLRDVLSFNASPLKFVHYISFSTFLTLLSVIALAFELCTLISTIAIISILYTNITSIIVFKIISKPEICKKIVFFEITNKGCNILSNHIVNWIDEYKDAIIKNNKSNIDMYSEILKECTKHMDNSIIKYSLHDLFDTACKNHSVADSILLVFDSIGLSSCILDVCKESISSIEYYEETDIKKLNLPSAIDSIISSNRLGYNIKIELPYCYFKAIIQSTMTIEEKIELLKIAIDKITNITDNEMGSVKSKVIYRIFINDIICSDNELSTELYKILMKSIYCNNVSSSNDILVSTIAQILRGFYFYSTLSIKVFDEEKRNRIKNIAKSNIMLDWLTDVSLKQWIIRFRYEFLIYYLRDTFEIEYIMCENLNTNVSKIEQYEHVSLWNSNNKLKFAFWYYFAFISNNKDFPLHECKKGVHKWIDYPQKIYDSLFDEFQENSSSLTDCCLTHIKTLVDYFSNIKTWSILPERLQKTHMIIKSVIEEENT